MGVERHGRSPEGEHAGASESIEPMRGTTGPLSNETEGTLEAGAGMGADGSRATWPKPEG